MSEHTPGPWHGHQGTNLSIWAKQRGRASLFICEASQGRADANLIAAAPDLLTACRAVTGVLDLGMSIDANSDLAGGIRAAIDKATGADGG